VEVFTLPNGVSFTLPRPLGALLLTPQPGSGGASSAVTKAVRSLPPRPQTAPADSRTKNDRYSWLPGALRGPLGTTGPALLTLIAMGSAAGVAWARRKKP
jgi:hypothetical protein